MTLSIILFYLLMVFQDLLQEVKDLKTRVESLEAAHDDQEGIMTSWQAAHDDQEGIMTSWQAAHLVFHGA
jgi:hypothetical protein